ncbi:YeeE/YedE family protein [Denitromonas iodatirespirans]|uniref:YeeE/YedE family protein n=1 Tax=Denitromonas iodatirespirans TaxID=2795389 RepID=A0A944H9J7_DENI1|nr:YeeE/YedE family protein [Denitromonas iodatirespirans]MBT0959587.1 YeeE/YedE family protein [Denitromonas iodatirespirans]
MPSPHERPRVQWPVAAIALLALVALAAGLPARMAALLGIGALLGLTLFHAAFGFASAYRVAILRRDTAGVRAQLGMIALASVLFAPALADGALFGQAVGGAVAPVGVQVAVGAFLFGIGMQLGGGCGSGTLYTVGGGNRRMAITLVAFIAGSFWASLHMGDWQRLPSGPAVSLGHALGWWPAEVLQLAVLGGVAWWLKRVDVAPAAARRHRVWQGPWPLAAGAVLLALLNVATLALAGHPWTITWAFTLWGAKLASAAGWEAATAPFWQGGFQQAALAGSVFEDTTSVMDIGLLLGAMLAAALAGRYAARRPMPWRTVVAAAVGGGLMGYGARIAFGCNIGAFVAGVASTSLHGWLWIVCAIPGTLWGIRLRPLFGLANESTNRQEGEDEGRR